MTFTTGYMTEEFLHVWQYKPGLYKQIIQGVHFSFLEQTEQQATTREYLICKFIHPWKPKGSKARNITHISGLVPKHNGAIISEHIGCKTKQYLKCNYLDKSTSLQMAGHLSSCLLADISQ